MTKVSQADLTAFGTAVKRARSLRGWTLDQLGYQVDPPVGKSFVSKVEKGRKENLNSRTVGRFIKALDLDEGWIDKFLDTDTIEDGEETKSERDADRILERLVREDATKGASEDLLIQLANQYAEGTHRDRQTAFDAVKQALEAYTDMKARGALGSNADDQFAGVMTEVDRLNDSGDVHSAGDVLEDAMARAEQSIEAIFQRQLVQDRLRNRPDLAAKRLIDDLRRQPERGKLFLAVNRLAREWRDDGDQRGDMFTLRVALRIARSNYDKLKGRRGLETAALHTLGWCYFRLAERSTRARDLELARNAFDGALSKTSKKKEPEKWSLYQSGLGIVLTEMGERSLDTDTLRQAVAAQRAVLDVEQTSPRAKDIDTTWNSLGNALLKLGEITRDSVPVAEAIEASHTALSLVNKQTDPLRWEAWQNNLGLALRWHGELTGDRDQLSAAREAYRKCENNETRDTAAFRWAALQWNIADLALAQYDLDPDAAFLDEAEQHVTAAREVFAEGSDYQTQRCDDLLDRITTYRAAR